MLEYFFHNWQLFPHKTVWVQVKDSALSGILLKEHKKKNGHSETEKHVRVSYKAKISFSRPTSCIPLMYKIWAMWSVIESHGSFGKKNSCNVVRSGESTLCPPPSPHHSLGHFSCTNPIMLFTANHCHYSQYQQSWQDNFYIRVFFLAMKPNRDLSVFLAGNWGRNQMSFLLRSAGVGREKKQKKYFNRPLP